MANPVIWLDARSEASLVRDDKGRIAEWKDRRGTGKAVEQKVEARRPVVSSSSPAVVFNGTEWLAASQLGEVKSGQASVFVIFQTTEEHPRRIMGLVGSGDVAGKTAGFVIGVNDRNVVTGNNAVAFAVHDGKQSTAELLKAGDARAMGLDRALAPQFPLMVTATFRVGEKPFSVIRVQGKALETKIKLPSLPAETNVLSDLAIGAADALGRLPFTGAIGEVLVYDRALSEKECEAVEQWLTARHGLKVPEPFLFAPKVQPMAAGNRPQLVTPDGALLRLSDDAIFEKRGDAEWTKRWDVARDPNFADLPLSGGQLAMTPKGTLVLILKDRRPQGFVKLTRKDGAFTSKEAKTDVYAFRSLDGGKTWQDGQKLQSDYCGAMRDIKVTRDGGIVASLQAWDPKTERHITVVQTSKDDGKTYHASRLDNGIGYGLHDGFFESTLTELSDGRLWLLGRTGLGVFWQAYSADGGLNWTKPEASNIESGSYPGYLLRLKSGRILLAWNRYYPDGYAGRGDLINVAGTGWFWGMKPVSRFNRELSIMLSEDDGKTWTQPTVIVEGRQDFSAVSYPFLLEEKPGEILLWAGPVAAKFREADFAGQERHVH